MESLNEEWYCWKCNSHVHNNECDCPDKIPKGWMNKEKIKIMKLYEIKYFSVGQYLGVDIVITENEEEAEKLAQIKKFVWHKIKEIDLQTAYPGILGNKCDL